MRLLLTRLIGITLILSLVYSLQHKPNIYIYIYIYYRSAILGIIFLGELGFLILLDLDLWQFKPHTRPTSTYQKYNQPECHYNILALTIHQFFYFGLFEKVLQFLLRGWNTKMHFFMFIRLKNTISKVNQMPYSHIFKLPIRFRPKKL